MSSLHKLEISWDSRSQDEMGCSRSHLYVIRNNKNIFVHILHSSHIFKRKYECGVIFQTYVDIMWNFGNINVTAVLFSVFTISSLVIFNEVLKVSCRILIANL